MADEHKHQETWIVGTLDGTDDGAATAEDATTAPQTIPQVPGYQILSLLGRGGMGQVFLAQNEQLGRRVALKFLAAGASAGSKALDRFRAEARAVAAIEHPGICQIFEAGQADGIPFLAIEYIDGPTLSEVVREQLPTPGQAARHALAIAQAMEASHQAGILHRDLKPSNVMLDGRGNLKVMDFGLAKNLDDDEHRTHTGEILGTPAYMAPEQASGVVRQLGPPCDVYAIGTILYELLTGRPPFVTPEAMQTVMLVLTTDPPPPRQLQPKVPIDLQTICLKCLEKKPKKRYQSAGELAADLQRFLEHRPIQARRISAPEKLLKWAGRKPAAAALLLATTFAIVAAAAGTVFHVTTLEAELQRSQRLLNGMTDFGAWLVRDHVPQIAQLRGGGPQQAELVDHTLAYLRQIQQDAADDDRLGEYVAEAYLHIAEVQAHPAFVTEDRLSQAMVSCENAIQIYEQLQSPNAPEKHNTLLATALLQLSKLQLNTGQWSAAQTSSARVIRLLEAATDDAKRLQRLTAQFQQTKASEQATSADDAWKHYEKILRECQQLTAESANRSRLLAAIEVARGRLLQQHGVSAFSDPEATASSYYTAAVAWLEHIQEPQPTDQMLLADAASQLASALLRDGAEASAADAFRTALVAQRTAFAELPESTIVLHPLLEWQQTLFELPTTDMTSRVELADRYLADAQQLMRLSADHAEPKLRLAWLMKSEVSRDRQQFFAAQEQLQNAINIAQQTFNQSDSVEDTLVLADLFYRQAELFKQQVEQRSTVARSHGLLTDADRAIRRSVELFQQVSQPGDFAQDSTYWRAVRLQHSIEADLEQATLQLREADSTTPNNRGGRPKLQTAE